MTITSLWTVEKVEPLDKSLSYSYQEMQELHPAYKTNQLPNFSLLVSIALKSSRQTRSYVYRRICISFMLSLLDWLGAAHRSQRVSLRWSVLRHCSHSWCLPSPLKRFRLHKRTFCSMVICGYPLGIAWATEATHPFIHPFLVPFILPRGAWSLSQRTWGRRWGTPWMWWTETGVPEGNAQPQRF